jgi:hypothetical protein
MEDIWTMKKQLPDFMGTDPVGWITAAESFFEKNEVPSGDKLQWAFMSMEDEQAMMWFYYWCEENPDADWKTFSIALGSRFGKRNYNNVVEEQLTEDGEVIAPVFSEKKENELDPEGEGNGFEDQTLYSDLKCAEEISEKQIEQSPNLPLSPKLSLATPPGTVSPEPEPPLRNSLFRLPPPRPPDTGPLTTTLPRRAMDFPPPSKPPDTVGNNRISPASYGTVQVRLVVVDGKDLEKLRVEWVMCESGHVLTLLDQTHHNLSEWEKGIKTWARLEPLKQAQNKVCLLSNPCVQKMHVVVKWGINDAARENRSNEVLNCIKGIIKLLIETYKSLDPLGEFVIANSFVDDQGHGSEFGLCMKLEACGHDVVVFKLVDTYSKLCDHDVVVSLLMDTYFKLVSLDCALWVFKNWVIVIMQNKLNLITSLEFFSGPSLLSRDESMLCSNDYRQLFG